MVNRGYQTIYMIREIIKTMAKRPRCLISENGVTPRVPDCVEFVVEFVSVEFVHDTELILEVLFVKVISEHYHEHE